MCSNTIMLRILNGKLYLSYVAYVYNGKLVSLIGNQRIGIFPPKSENSLLPIPSFDIDIKISRI